VAAGAGVVGALPAGTSLSLPVKVVAPGLMVMAIIYFMGTVSGRSPEPRSDLGLRPPRRLSLAPGAGLPGGPSGRLVRRRRLPGGDVRGHQERRHTAGHGHTNAQAFVTELILTLGLVSVILGTATGARNIGANAALAVGGYIGVVVVWGAPVSGASMNPIRSLGPAAVAGAMSTYWIYLIAPVVGATVAVVFEFTLRGRGGAGRTAAEGTDAQDPTAT
jgi:aquaporin Z